MLLVNRFNGPLLIWAAGEDAEESFGHMRWVFVVFSSLVEDVVDELVLEGNTDGG